MLFLFFSNFIVFPSIFSSANSTKSRPSIYKSIFFRVWMSFFTLSFKRIQLIPRKISYSARIIIPRLFNRSPLANTAHLAPFTVNIPIPFLVFVPVKAKNTSIPRLNFFLFRRGKWIVPFFFSYSPPQKIFFLTNRLQMFRIDTGAISTDMVYLKTFSNRTLIHFIGKSMSIYIHPFWSRFKDKLAISRASINIFKKLARTSLDYSVQKFPFQFFHAGGIS